LQAFSFSYDIGVFRLTRLSERLILIVAGAKVISCRRGTETTNDEVGRDGKTKKIDSFDVDEFGCGVVNGIECLEIVRRG
jgi:hypothetical protein